MPLGNTEVFLLNVKTMNKANDAQILLGKVAIRDTAITPDGWKQCGSAGAAGPFCVAVNQLAATTATKFAAAFAPSEVVMKAGGAIQPGELVQTDANGDVVALTATEELKVVGRYIGKEGVNTTDAAAQNDLIRVRLGLG